MANGAVLTIERGETTEMYKILAARYGYDHEAVRHMQKVAGLFAAEKAAVACNFTEEAFAEGFIERGSSAEGAKVHARQLWHDLVIVKGRVIANRVAAEREAGELEAIKSERASSAYRAGRL